MFSVGSVDVPLSTRVFFGPSLSESAGLYSVHMAPVSLPQSEYSLSTLLFLYLWRVWVRRGGFIVSWWGNRREGDHWGDLGVDGWIILGWISWRWNVGIWAELGWPRIETGGGRL